MRALQGAIWHCHAKYTAIHEWNSTVNGTLDTQWYRDELNRSGLFLTVGYVPPRPLLFYLVSALPLSGYDGVL